MEIPNHSINMQFFAKGELWILEAILFIALLILINYIFKNLFKYLRRRFISRSNDWKEKIDQIFYPPIHWTLWMIGVVFIVDLMAHRFAFSMGLVYLKTIRNCGIVCTASWLLLRWKKEIQHGMLAKQGPKRVDPSMVHIISRLATMSIVVIGSLIILQFLGLNITPLLAFGGIGAAAIAFASRDVISNFFGGFMLYVTRPFTIGDLIVIPDKKVEGTVEEIGWYITSIRDKDKRALYLPNAIFSSQVVINSSRMSHRRIEEKIGLSYDDFPKIDKIVKEIKEMISAHPSIDTHLPVLVFFNQFNEYSLGIFIEVYTLATRLDQYLAVKQDILFQIQKIIGGAGAKMPFPTMTLNMESEVQSLHNKD